MPARYRNRSLKDQFWVGFTSNLGTKLISVAIAVVLWMIVLGSRNVEAIKEIPLEIITPTDVVASNEVPDRIAFRLSGPKAFLRTVLDRKEEPLRVNLAGAKPGVVTYRFLSDNIRLPISVKVMSINPASVVLKLEAVKKREVPVKIELRGIVPDGYRILKAEIKPMMVRIKGADSKVDAISELNSIPIDVSDLRQTTERELAFDLPRLGVQIEGPLPKVLLEVESAGANFRIKNVDVRVVADFKYKLEEKTVSVLVRADPDDLKSVTRKKIYGVVDLTGKPKGKYNESVKVTLPEGVGIVKVVPEKVNVTLY